MVLGSEPGTVAVSFLALSNAASLLGLASCPFVIEPIMGLRHQAVVRQFGLRMVQVDSPGHFETGTRNDSWVILGPPGHPIFDVPRLAAAVTEQEPAAITSARARLWTDDYSSLWPLVRG